MWTSTAHAEPTYRYRTDDGREAFTNVRSYAPSTATVEEVDLPSLVHMDLAQANEAELQRINERLARRHREMLASRTCAEALEEGEVPWWRRTYREHPHWVWIAALLLLMAGLGRWFGAALPPGMWTRTMIIMVPLLVSVGILGSLAASMADTLATARAETEACTRPLSPVGKGDKRGTRRRAGIVGEVQRVLHARERRLAAQVDALTDS